MNFPLKAHQLISHWVPGLIVLMTLVLSYFKWNYTDFINVFARQGSVATTSIILLSIVAFVIGEFIDCIRDLLEYVWDLTGYKIDCERLFSNDPEMLEKRDSYWTYYVMSSNIVISSLLCLFLYRLKIIILIPGTIISCTGWLIGIFIVGVFTANACTLRYELCKITNKKKENLSND